MQEPGSKLIIRRNQAGVNRIEVVCITGRNNGKDMLKYQSEENA